MSAPSPLLVSMTRCTVATSLLLVLGLTSVIDSSHVGVAIALGRGNVVVDPRQLVGGERHSGGGHVLLEIRDPFSARYRHDVAALRLNPGQCDLPGRASLPAGQFLNPIHHCQVGAEVLVTEAGEPPHAGVALRHVLRGAVAAGEESSTPWAVGHEADPQLPHRG